MKVQLIFFLILFSFLYFLCNKNPIKPNNPPQITSITANPSTVQPNETSILSVTATDQDNDNLTYTWKSDKGTFPNGNNNKSVTWKAPNLEGDFTCTVTVSDGKDKVSESLTIKVKIKTGILSINSSPQNANIYVDGTLKGTTPRDFTLPIGSYQVKITKQDYKDWGPHSYNVYENQTTIVNATLEKIILKGILSVNSDPTGADIFINNEETNKITNHNFELDPGTYSVKLIKKGYEWWGPNNYDVIVNKTTNVYTKLNILPGALGIDSSPRDAKIYINNNYTGKKTPASITLSPGTYSVKLVLSGYKDWKSSVTIETNKITQVFATLEKEYEEYSKTIYVSQDSWVNAYLPEKNYGNSWYFRIGQLEGKKFMAFLYFDISSIPSDAQITYGKLVLNCFDLTYDDSYVSAYAVKETWNENTINGYNRPSWHTNRYDQIKIIKGNNAWDVKELVKDWISGKIKNYGIFLMTDYNRDEISAFYSKEKGGSLRPSLQIKYLR